MMTSQQIIALGKAFEVAAAAECKVINIEFTDSGTNVWMTPVWMRTPELRIFDLTDILATWDAGLRVGTEQAKTQLLATYDNGFNQGMQEGLAIEHDAWAGDVEDHFGEAGRLFVEQQRRLFEAAEAHRNSDHFENEQEQPQGSFHEEATDGPKQVGSSTSNQGNGNQADPNTYDDGEGFNLTGMFGQIALGLMVMFLEDGMQITGTVDEIPIDITIRNINPQTTDNKPN